MVHKQRLRHECMAEFTGTFLFLVVGIGCIAALKLAGVHYGQWETSLIWGMAVALAVYLSGGVSDAHLNPSVTLAFAVFGGFPAHKILPYMGAQMLGAFTAAAVVYFLYADLFVTKTLETAGIFTTFPDPHISLLRAFMTELFITAVLVAVIFGLFDTYNGTARGALNPLLIGLLVAIIGAAFGPLTGFSMNAARDFAPRLFASLAGWGPEAMTGGKAVPYALVPLTAPALGALAGAYFYTRLIGGPLARQHSALPGHGDREEIH